MVSLLQITATNTTSPGYYTWSGNFLGWHDERVYGLGERMTGALDNKGQVIDFRKDQTNTHITIPFAVSSRHYGFFWNHPGWGQLILANNSTTWTADLAKQLDFLVMTSQSPSEVSSSPSNKVDTEHEHEALSPSHAASRAEISPSPFADITGRYYDAIGHPPMLPEWALGLWASKQRYASQTEILEVVDNYTKVPPPSPSPSPSP